MKKISCILFLFVAFIAPECRAMKMMPNVLKKCVVSNKKIMRRTSSSSGNTLSNLVLIGVTGGGTLGFLGCGSMCSFRSGKFDAIGDKDKADLNIIGALIVVLGTEYIVAALGGPSLVYLMSQPVFYAAGYYKGKYSEKKKLENQKKD